MSAAQSLYEIFAGSDASHGTYAHEDVIDGAPKIDIKRTARTLREPASPDHWQMHLNGTRALGIVPIGPGDCCKWACLDIDQYNGMDHGEIAKKLDDAHVPAIVCKSKSGGAHVFMFFKEPLLAVLVIAKAQQLAVLIGHSGCEVFPRQASVDTGKDQLGNWLNMPYFNGNQTKRYAVKSNGNGLTVDEFVTLALKNQMTAQEFGDLKLRKSVEEFSDGPPCLETLISTGFPVGHRNDGLFELITLAKKVDPNNWKDLAKEWNRKYVKLSEDEALTTIKSNGKKKYNYRCAQEPIKSVCNSTLCRTRKYGVGDGMQDISILKTITVYESDPPIFIVGLELSDRHVIVKVPGDRLKNPDLFQTAVLNTHYQLIPSFRVAAWTKRVAELLDEAQKIEAPGAAGEKGHFFELLNGFLTEQYVAETREEILANKPWLNDEDGHYYFRLQDLHKALEQNKFTPAGGRTRAWIASELRDLGGEDKHLRIKGKHTPIAVFRVKADLFEGGTKLGLPNVDESPL